MTGEAKNVVAGGGYSPPPARLLSVIMPVYNEQDTVVGMVGRVLEAGIDPVDIVVVEDGSGDDTRRRLESEEWPACVRIVFHEKNQGKGAAIRTGQRYVTGDAVVIQDADQEYDPAELPRLLDAMDRFGADAVYGSRYSGTEVIVDGFWHYYGNKGLTFFSNLCSNLHLTDMETCYKMIRGDLFRSLQLECNRFGIEPELTAKLAATGCTICEVPISYRARRFEEGKKIGLKDGLAALWYIAKYNFFAGKSEARIVHADAEGAIDRCG